MRCDKVSYQVVAVIYYNQLFVRIVLSLEVDECLAHKCAAIARGHNTTDQRLRIGRDRYWSAMFSPLWGDCMMGLNGRGKRRGRRGKLCLSPDLGKRTRRGRLTSS